jgi:DNA-binding SARP family transcriptional activator
MIEGDDEITVSTTGRRVVLGLLGLSGHQPVSRAKLTDALWQGVPPPASAANVIQTHVKHLRRQLEPERPSRTPSSLLPMVGDGYVLRAGTDVADFRALVAQATAAARAGDYERAGSAYAAALDLWRADTPLADVPTLAGHPLVLALAEERTDALAGHGTALLTLGAAEAAVPLLEQAARARPLDERTIARLIRAYATAGNRAAAVIAFHDVRHRLADEMGIDPGAELTAVYRELLAEDTARRTGPRRYAVPATLPGDVTDFVGRQRELADLDRLLAADGAGVPIVLISGTAGVGKTALALRWAHRARSRFPDGQVYVNLRGYDAQQPVSGADALARLLSALGLSAAEIPLDVADRTARLRTELCGRRVLFVLDNASSVDQVRPLLPGAATCAVVVTSRDAAADLVAWHGARRLHLEPLPLGDAVDLLNRLIGDEADADSGQGMALAAQCVGLPLALRVAADLAVTRRNTSLSQLVDELSDRRDRLDLLDSVGSSVSAVFSWSYQHLPEPVQHVFRNLGLYFGPHVSLGAASALAGQDLADTRAALIHLCRAHLVEMVETDRYAMHDLLRAYASQLAHDSFTPADRASAVRRLTDYYLHAAHTANCYIDYRAPVDPPPPLEDIRQEAFTGRESALTWFCVEHQVLLAAVDAAPDTHVSHLARVLSTYLEQRGHWHDWLVVERAALAATTRRGDQPGIAAAHRELGRAMARMGSYAEADRLLCEAIARFTDLDDPLGQAHCHNNRILVFERQLNFENALEQATSALTKYRLARNQAGEARALNNMGWCHAQLARHAEAVDDCERALSLQQNIADCVGESATWDTLGFVHYRAGRHLEAIACYKKAHEIYRDFGDRFSEAELMDHLGDSAQAAGYADTARRAWQEAYDIFAELGHSTENLDIKLKSAGR